MAAVVQNMKMPLLNKSNIANLALTNQYQVTISGITGALKSYLGSSYGVKNEFLDGGMGIMCSEASLPTSSFATSEVKDNFQGINQQFAHTRIYIESDFTFYIDRNYHVLKFFEGWMDYVSGENNIRTGISKDDDPHYYRRFNYPMNSDNSIGYKCGSLEIAKFDRNMGMSFNQNYDNIITYKFINAFPKGMTSIPVSYGGADILKVNVQFAYDRYILNRVKSNSSSFENAIRMGNIVEVDKTLPKLGMSDKVLKAFSSTPPEKTGGGKTMDAFKGKTSLSFANAIQLGSESKGK